jgi:hypothetical protein
MNLIVGSRGWAEEPARQQRARSPCHKNGFDCGVSRKQLIENDPRSQFDINSGCIGINITRNQDTAVPCPLYHSGAVGIDMTRFFGSKPAR